MSEPSPGPVVFLGSGDFAVPMLAALAGAGEKVALVVTQPDRPKGRGRKLEPTPVGREAERLGLALFAPPTVNDPEAIARIASLRPEFLVVADYGQFIGKELLHLARRGPVNVHPSLLPKHRGPSPVAWAILSNDRSSGVSTMLMDEGMDSGPILLQREIPLEAATTAGELFTRLAEEGATLLVDTLAGMRSGAVTPTPQEEARATFSKLLTGELLAVDWGASASSAAGRINALSPRPGARAWLGRRLVKCLRAVPAEGRGTPGEILAADGEGLLVACGEGAVRLLELLPEGKRAMTAEAFVRGGYARVGDTFDRTAPTP